MPSTLARFQTAPDSRTYRNADEGVEHSWCNEMAPTSFSRFFWSAHGTSQEVRRAQKVIRSHNSCTATDHFADRRMIGYADGLMM